jgi:ADP-ribose pyrophosphatase YjhB (NUDIX family)
LREKSCLDSNIAVLNKYFKMEQIPNWFYRLSAKALILNQDKKFLLIREGKWWDLPWWWLEYWETPQECIRRELLEEMWINVKHIGENPSYFISAKKDNWIWVANVIYETQIGIDAIDNFKPSDECLEAKFFSIDDAQNETLFPNVKEFLKYFNSLNY